MKKLQFVSLLLCLALALGGCGDVTIGESQSNAGQSAQTGEQTVGQSQGEEQVLSNERIPTELSSEGVFVQHWQEWDRESLPAQYLMELDDTALMLIEQVQNVCAQASPADLFDGIGHASVSALLRVALDKTPAIDFPVQIARDEDGDVSASSEEYPDHVLVSLLQNEQEEGRDLREFYYQEDVAAVYARLFGEGRTLSFQDLCPQYYYYAREGVFAHRGERTPVAVWPMLVRYNDGESTATVDLLLTENPGEDQPLLYTRADGGVVELTADTYQEELAGEPVYRYTFAKDEDGTLTLTGIRQVGILNESCDAVIDAAEPLEDEAPELEVPERVMISSEDMQYEVDLQQEYEGTTAVDYLMDLLQGAQRVESAASDQVLAGNGARTLTMTMSYTGGEEVVLNIMSRGYLPGIESSYMTFSIGSRQYVLEQSAYTDFTACINTCRRAG